MLLYQGHRKNTNRSACQVQCGGDIFAGPGQFVKTLDGFISIKGFQSDIVSLQKLRQIFSNFHQPRCAAAYNQRRRLRRNNGLLIFRGQQMPLLSPPVCMHRFAKYQAIAVISNSINDNPTKLIRINPHYFTPNHPDK